MDTIKAIAELITQINNIRRLVTIGGKQFKWDGKKYKSVKDGKVYTRPQLIEYVKTQKYKAPDTPKSNKSSEELKTTKITTDSKGRRVVDPEGTKLKIKKQETFENKAKDKVNTVKTNLKSSANKTVGQGKNIFNNLKMKVQQPNAFSYEDTNKANAPTRSNKLANMLKMNKSIGAQTPKGGAVRGAIGSIGTAVANPLVDQVVDRLFRNISGNQKMSIEDYRAMMQQRRENWPNVLKSRALGREASEPLQIRNRRGRVTETVAPPEGTVIGRRNEQYIDRTDNQSTPTLKKEDSKEKVKVNKKKKNKSTVGKVMGDYAGSYNETKAKKTEKKKKNDPLKIHGKNPSSIQKKLIKAGFTTKELETLVTNYNKKYRNKRGW